MLYLQPLFMLRIAQMFVYLIFNSINPFECLLFANAYKRMFLFVYWHWNRNETSTLCVLYSLLYIDFHGERSLPVRNMPRYAIDKQ